MTEPVALSGPQRIIRRIVAERRAGAPDEMIARYAITEALHLLTGHDGPAADCTRCHDTTARAVDHVRTPTDMTGASIVVDPDVRADTDATSTGTQVGQVVCTVRCPHGESAAARAGAYGNVSFLIDRMTEHARRAADNDECGEDARR